MQPFAIQTIVHDGEERRGGGELAGEEGRGMEGTLGRGGGRGGGVEGGERARAGAGVGVEIEDKVAAWRQVLCTVV